MKEENPGQKVEDVNTHHNNETPSTGAEWQTVADQERKEEIVLEHIHAQTWVYLSSVRRKPQRPIGDKAKQQQQLISCYPVKGRL